MSLPDFDKLTATELRQSWHLHQCSGPCGQHYVCHCAHRDAPMGVCPDCVEGAAESEEQEAA